MFIRTLGIVLLALGFVMLASAALMRDPTALDANIGAGALTLFGVPLGALGLILVVVHAVYLTLRTRRSSRASARG